ncbi:MAG: EAL domain-containing protein [Pseudomonadales bacterium]|nr:EAL domain-containing protein [Pseudomonadales bacterium]
MKGYPRSFLITFCVALAYYLSGQLGLSLVISPSGAGLVWPSAGIALATVLVLGRPAIFGVFIGAFVTVFSLLPENVALLLASVNGLGSTLQAVVGAWLVQRYVWAPDRPITDRSVAILVLFGIPVSSVVSSTINLSAQWVVGSVDSGDFLIGWLSWWMGDTIGIFVFTPLAMLILGRSRPAWYEKRYLIGIPILLCFLVILGVIYKSIGLEKERLENEFQRQADSLAYALKVELKKQEKTLYTLGSFYQSSSFVSREQFRIFTENLLSDGHRHRALEWLPRIRKEDRKRFEEDNREYFPPPFQITERIGQGRALKPAGIRDEYLPIAYLEPIKGHERVIGYDVLSNSIIKEAIIRARDTGTLAITAPLQLIQAKPSRLNYVIYLPLYQKNSTVDSINSRREAFVGVLASVINFNTLAMAVFDGVGDEDINVRIFADKGDLKHVVPFYENIEELSSYPYQLSTQFDFMIASTPMKMEVTAQNSFVVTHSSGAIALLFFGSLLVSGLVTLFVLQMAIRSMRIEEIVNERTLALTNEVTERKEAEEQARLNEERFQRALRATNEGIWEWDIESGEMISIPSWEEFLGYEKGELPEHDIDIWRFLTHPDDKAAEKFEESQLVSELGSGRDHELRLRHKNGSWVWIRSRGEVVQRDDDGVPTRIIGTRIDITERKKAEEEMRIAAIAFETHEGILITNTDGVIVQVNQAFCEISGFQEVDVIGRHPDMFELSGENPESWDSIGNRLERDGRWEGETTTSRRSGETYPVHARITNVKNEAGEVTHTVSIFSDITQRKQDEEEIAKLAFFDPLTNLSNRRMLMMTVEHEMTVARRNDRHGGLIFLDLDHFKNINDSLGHSLGDLLLKQVAERLNSVIREVDIASRLGGDEFVVLLPSEADNEKDAANQALVVAEKIQRTINEAYDLEGFECRITTSIGIKLYPVDGDNPETLITNADTAMYQAKDEGRNTIRFYNHQMQAEADEWLNLKMDLHRAIEDDEFELYFQCQNHRDGTITGAEALIRWQHPSLGQISPMKFIPIAEQGGQIVEIGEWVIKKACGYLRQWQDAGLSLPHLSVNVSSHQFNHAGFIEMIKRALSDTGADPQSLMLELTEGVAVDQIDETIEKMTQLKELGIGFSIDDFGTGYSSLSYLKRLPLDQLKIDRVFVRDIATDPNDAVIVETIISMANHLQFGVIAEGVETEEQLNFLMEKGCTEYQGYYFSKPAPVDQFIQRLVANAAMGDSHEGKAI